MKKIKFPLLFLISIVALAGCYNLGFIGKLNCRLGMSPSDIIQIVDDESYMGLINDGTDDIYDISKDVSDKSSKYEVLITNIRNINDNTYYVFTFKDSKLIYWGYPYEYSASPKPLFRQIGEASSKVILEEYED